MLMNFIIGILIAIIFENLYLIFKYKNIKYTYKIKNNIYDIIRSYEELLRDNKLDEYNHLKQILTSKVKELIKIRDIKNIKQIDVYENKNNDSQQLNNMLKDLAKLFKANKSKDENAMKIIAILENIERTSELILKKRKPFLYIKLVLKKIIQIRILIFAVRILNLMYKILKLTQKMKKRT